MDIKDKETFKRIVLILAIAAFFLWCAINPVTALTSALNIFSLLVPLLVGAAMAFVLNAVLKLFENKIFIHITNNVDPQKRSGRFWRAFVRPLSLILTLVVVLGVVIFVVALIVPELRRSITLIAAELPAYITYTQNWIDKTLQTIGLDLAISLPAVNWHELIKGLGAFLSGEGSDLLTNVTSFTTGVFGVVANVVVGFVFSIYILLQKEKLSRQLKSVIYALFSEKKANMFFGVGRLSNEIFGKFITGQFLEAIIIGTLCFVGMKILSLTDFFEFPYALMISEN